MPQLPPNYQKNWPAFNLKQASRPVRGLCQKVSNLAGDGAGRQALDLGAGAGIETRYLLEEGWRVLALDSADNSRALITQAAGELADRLSLDTSTFEEITQLPPLDLVYSGYSLPFCSPETFKNLWHILTTSLLPGGYLALNLFGTRDAWHPNPEMTFIESTDLENLLEGFDLLYLQEEAAEGPSFSGPKFWHTFDLIARKKA